MQQSKEVEYRTEIAQLKASLHRLRFALPLKKAAEELIVMYEKPFAPTLVEFHRKIVNLKEALENK